jgi:radical SAM superfamily enzyme
MKNTAMERTFAMHPERFRFFELEEYIEFIIDVTERLNPRFVIERFSGEAPPRHTLSPRWGLRTPDVMNKIEQRMKERNTWQGAKFAGL